MVSSDGVKKTRTGSDRVVRKYKYEKPRNQDQHLEALYEELSLSPKENAHVLDFNSQYECANLRRDMSVVFLGADQSRVLVDSNNTQIGDLESFIDGQKSSQIVVSKKFRCLAL